MKHLEYSKNCIFLFSTKKYNKFKYNTFKSIYDDAYQEWFVHGKSDGYYNRMYNDKRGPYSKCIHYESILEQIQFLIAYSEGYEIGFDKGHDIKSQNKNFSNCEKK